MSKYVKKLGGSHMRKIGRYLLILLVSITPQLLAGTVYYVDSINGNDGNAGTSSAAAWRTVAKINARSFSAGDQVLFVRGGVWRERLAIPSSGTAANPITFGAYGSGADPVITGTDLVTDWTSYSTNIWRAPLATQARVVLFDGVKGNIKSGISDIASSCDWYWGSNELYVYSTNNPSLIYGSPGIEAGTRDEVIVVNKAFITLENLHVCGSNSSWGGAISANGPTGGNSITLTSCTIEKNNSFGILFLNCGNHTVTDCTVQYNTVIGLFFYLTVVGYSNSNNFISGGTYAHNNGIGILVRGSDNIKIENFGTISNVTAYGNGDNIYFNRADDGVISHSTLYGSVAGGEGYGVGICNGDNIIVEYCDIYDNWGRGIGIACDEVLQPSTNDIVRYNRIHGNGKNTAIDMVGVQINYGGAGAVCTGIQIYYNLIYDHIRTSPDRGRGVYIEGASVSVFNNVFYNNQEAVGLLVPQANYCSIKNNIFLGSITFHIGVWAGVTGSDFNFNTYYPNTGSMFVWNYSGCNFANWKTITAQDSYSRSADPKFTDVSKKDFHLRSDSPCIDAGINLGLKKDFYGDPVPFGNGVDVGAVEFEAGSIPLAASITASPTTGDAPLAVNFTASVSGGSSPYSFNWNFGDGQSSTTQNPSHTYPSAGSYTATLIVTDNASATASSTANIDVIANVSLSANIYASPTSGQAPLAVNFTGSASGGTSPYSYSWTFGDGGSSTTQNPSHTYSSAGSYAATLTVTDNPSATISSTVNISVTANVPLSAGIVASPTSGQAPLAVNFTGSASGGTSPYSYSWAFGDGVSSASQNPSHTYSSAGSYTATLTVTDSKSATNSNSLAITVTAAPTPVVASASGSTASGQAPLAVNFTGSASGGTAPYTYSWAFGDGVTSASQNPSHTYSSAGSYTATLTVTDSKSTTNSNTLTITVTAAPTPLVASASGSTASGQAPLAVNFTGSASGGTSPYSYGWTFGDGSSSTSQNPSHTYSSAGSYTATLTVTDSQSATNSNSLTITVTAAPTPVVASASGSTASGQAPLAVNLTGSASGGTSPYSYSWTFGDGSSSTSQNPSHTYSSAGSYTATLTVTDSKSATNSKSLTITVTAAPTPVVASASGSTASGQAPLAVNFTGSASGGTSPYSYSWAFGDGVSSASQNPSHSYSSAGSYTATLTVTDSKTATNSKSLTITVTAAPTPVVASASGSTASGQAPLAVNFTGSASGGTSPYTYRWTFGDGGSSTTRNPSHSYSSAGSFTATLTVTDSKSATNSKSLAITVTAAGSLRVINSHLKIVPNKKSKR